MKFIISLSIVSLLWCTTTAQRIELSNNWTYSFHSKLPGDTVNKPSEKEMPWVEKDAMLRKSGLVYFRRSVVIPSSLKQQWATTGVAALYPGRVLQADETFLNGKSIGKTGSADVQRVYLIPADIIKWDAEIS